MDSPEVLPPSGPPLTSRPVPPLPNRPPLLPDKAPIETPAAPLRPAPIPPTRPTPPVPPPSKSAASRANNSSQNRNSTSGRPRPVITVVDARPMTEVGFRDLPSVPGGPPAPSDTAMSNGNQGNGSIPTRPAPPSRPPSFRRSAPPVDDEGAQSPTFDPERPLPVPPRPGVPKINNPLSMLANVINPVKAAQDNNIKDTLVNEEFDTGSIGSGRSNGHIEAINDNPINNPIDAPTPIDAQPALIDFDGNAETIADDQNDAGSGADWGAAPDPEDSFDVNYTDSTLPASASGQASGQATCQGLVSDKDLLGDDNDGFTDPVQSSPPEEPPHVRMGGKAVLPSELLGAALARRRSQSPRSSIGDDWSTGSVSPRHSPVPERRAPGGPPVGPSGPREDSGFAGGKAPPPSTPTKPKKSFMEELHKSLSRPSGFPSNNTASTEGDGKAEDIYAVPHKVRKDPPAQPTIPRSATFPVNGPPPVKPKPSLMPKPGLKPKPSIKSKPAGPVVPKPVENKPDEPEQTNYSYTTGRNRMSALIKEMEQKSPAPAPGAAGSAGPGFGGLKSRSPPKPDSGDESSSSKQEAPEVASQPVPASKRPGPMKATYRPTIIRPTAPAASTSSPATDKEEKEDDDSAVPPPAPLTSGTGRSISVSDISARFNQAISNQDQEKPGPVTRRKPTIIRAGSRNSIIAGTNTATSDTGDKPAFQPKPRPRSMMSPAMSMPNIAKSAEDDFKVVGPTGSHEDLENASNEKREGTVAPPRPAPRRQTPPASPTLGGRSNQAAARNRVSQAIVQPNVLSELRRNFDEPEVPFPLAEPPKGSEPKKLAPAKPPPPKVGPGRPATPPAVRRGPAPGQGAPTSKDNRPPRPNSGPPPRPTSGPKKSPTARNSTGLPPNLPNRPGPGHPLFHYVVSGPHGIALFDYNSDQPGDLCFKAGDTIILKEQVDAEWLMGKLGSQEGMFPANFLDIVEPLPKNTINKAPVKPNRTSQTSSAPATHGVGPRCLARFDYDGEEKDDLQFKAGDVIKLLSRIGDDWFKGELHGRQGMFPAGYVEVVEDLPPGYTAQPAPDKTGNVVNALHDFNGEADELSFKAGEKITVKSKLDDIWLYGEIGARTGTFPGNFVDRIPAGLPDYVKPSPASAAPGAPASSPGGTGSQSPGGGAYCLALYTFPGETEGDLPFQKGDKIQLLEGVDADWLKGSLNGRTGVFPAGFVNIVKDLDAPDGLPQRPSAPAVTKPTPAGRALYDFAGETADDLSFQAGETVELVEQIDSNWMKGKIHGKVGMFPASFVEVVVPL